MKKFKKIIILVFFCIGIIIIMIYKNFLNKKYENFEYDSFITNNELEQKNEINNKTIVLHIAGEVVNPGVVTIKEGSRIIDAIEAAGGLTQNANINNINLAFIVSDGQKIYIPSMYEEEKKAYITSESQEGIIENSLANNQTNKININSATKEELEKLTGIGPSIALKIINYRKENGNFKSIEELKKVPGVGEAKYEAIKNDICI